MCGAPREGGGAVCVSQQLVSQSAGQAIQDQTNICNRSLQSKCNTSRLVKARPGLQASLYMLASSQEHLEG